MITSIIQSGATFAVNAGFASAVGVVASAVWLTGSGLPKDNGLAKRLIRILQWSIAGCIIAGFLSIVQAAASLADVPLTEVSISLLLTFAGTYYAQGALLSIASLSFAFAYLAIPLFRRSDALPEVSPIIGALLIFALSRAAISHGGENGLMSIAYFVETLHVMSMALWSGTVFLAGLVVIPCLIRTGNEATIAGYLPKLSNGATLALATVLSTGAYNMWRVLTSPTDLVTTAYGWALTTKLTLVAMAIALGGWNRMVEMPRSLADCGSGTSSSNGFKKVLQIEVVVMVLVLAAAAVLINSAPPSAN